MTTATTSFEKLDARAQVPPALRKLFKDFKALPVANVDGHPGVLDLQSDAAGDSNPKLRLVSTLAENELLPIYERFSGSPAVSRARDEAVEWPSPRPVYEHDDVPGLRIYPSLLPRDVQRALLSRMIHRDLVQKEHQTNLHMHYAIPYPTCSEGEAVRNVSFFAEDTSREIAPIDPKVHKPLTIENMLKKKLRWVTLGGQYDWTDKVYPTAPPPAFPPDIAALIQDLFPGTKAEAAIVNFYSPGDVLSVHRDVSEECDVPLISISIGCDALFLIGHGDAEGGEIIRLRSGDAVCMSGASRFAWHAVPKIVPGTCPEWLQAWPGDDEQHPQYANWKGWMAGKRVNLNVRQMKPA